MTLLSSTGPAAQALPLTVADPMWSAPCGAGPMWWLKFSETFKLEQEKVLITYDFFHFYFIFVDT